MSSLSSGTVIITLIIFKQKMVKAMSLMSSIATQADGVAHCHNLKRRDSEILS